MSAGKVHDEASTVDSAPGEVMISGPGGVVVSMTPDAAAATASKLLAHAEKARSGVIGGPALDDLDDG